MIDYPTYTLPRLRYQYCPHCATPLTEAVLADDELARVICPQCHWVHYPTNAMGVNVIITTEDGIVALLPSDGTPTAPAALPGGHVEYGESPAEAAIREAYEETGLVVEIVRELGWYFNKTADYPGPMLSFIFEVRAIGGALRKSEEGVVAIFPIENFPTIAPNPNG